MSPRVHPAELSDAGLAQLLRTETDPERRRTAQVEALCRLPVKTLVGGGYMVASRTVAGAWWHVVFAPGARESGPWACTCPAEVPRCYHARQVEAYCRLADAMHSRPTPPPNVSALVD